MNLNGHEISTTIPNLDMKKSDFKMFLDFGCLVLDGNCTSVASEVPGFRLINKTGYNLCQQSVSRPTEQMLRFYQEL